MIYRILIIVFVLMFLYGCSDCSYNAEQFLQDFSNGEILPYSDLTKEVKCIDNPNYSSNKYNTSVLEALVVVGDFNSIAALLERGARVNEGVGTYPLIEAVGYERIDVVNLLIAYGADVNCIELSSTTTPLIMAINQGSLEVVEVLLANGADLNIDTKFGTPLEYAQSQGEEDIALFIEAYLEITRGLDKQSGRKKRGQESIRDISSRGEKKGTEKKEKKGTFSILFGTRIALIANCTIAAPAAGD